MKAVAIILSILIFVTCLIIGIQAGNTALPTASPQVTSTSQSTSTLNQRTYIVAGVDDLSAQEPRLVSLWVLFFRPGYPHLTALALYPENQMPLSASAMKLQSSFSLTPEKTLSSDFITALQQYHFPWNGTTVIDKVGTAILVDWLGGIDLAGVHYDGNGALTMLTNPWSDPIAALNSQYSLGQSLCIGATKNPGGLTWTNLSGALAPGHLATDVGLEEITEDFSNLLNGEASLTCEFPEWLE